ncbi:hypothetical protein MNBD_UNCLBAC01-1102 [hydrothermal vent metagenome]|uniref:Glycosyltransferase n=1 Tax=hydrothermal vent metagenome TaxID=652676 RepID=A0A3B1DIT9_9ZZZZ
MKILQVVLSLKCGGLEKLVIHLSEKLKERGHYVEIVCLGQKGELGEEAERKGIFVTSLNKNDGVDLKLLWRLKKIIKEKEIDLLHTHNMSPLIYGSLVARWVGIKMVNTRHGRASHKTYRFIWNLTSRVVAISDDARTELLQHNFIEENKVKVIYNAINLSDFEFIKNIQFKTQVWHDFGLQSDSLLIGIVARLSIEKDHKTLIKAFQRIAESSMDVKLLIIGDGQLKENLKSLVKKLNIENKVKFLGFRKDIPELINILDLFVLSSTMEGVSLTLLEAMAAGKPVIATNVGGNPEVVVDGDTGLLVPSGDPKKMAEAIIKILSDKELAAQMGNAGRKRVEKFFSLEKMVDKYEKIYQEVI